jgi:2-amino-4-hydroxy-6-hydroxymethyldihydropteridine diphosphokinase
MSGVESNNQLSETAYLLFGSNLGDRMAMIEEAVNKVSERAGRLVAISSVYESDPWGFQHENLFLNQAISIQTTESPGRLMKILLSVEREMKRIRYGSGYHARNIDIDFLLYGQDIICQRDLVVPHPLLAERRFALVPLEEIASGVLHPYLKISIASLLTACKDTGRVWKFSFK